VLDCVRVSAASAVQERRSAASRPTSRKKRSAWSVNWLPIAGSGRSTLKQVMRAGVRCIGMPYSVVPTATTHWGTISQSTQDGRDL
jgi:hypothetical protein